MKSTMRNIRGGIAGLALVAGLSFGGTNDVVSVSAKVPIAPLEQTIDQRPVILKQEFSNRTFPNIGTNANISITNFPHTGNWYLLVADKLEGSSTNWKPATNQGYTHPRFGYISGAYPFVVEDSKTIIITEYIEGKDTQFFKISDNPIIN